MKNKKKSLKRKIQNALFTSSFLSIIISMLTLFLLMLLLAQPIGGLLTSSVNNSIYRTYSTVAESNLTDNSIRNFKESTKRIPLDSFDYKILKTMEFGNVKVFSKDMNEEEMLEFQQNVEEARYSHFTVYGDDDYAITDDEKRNLMLSTIMTIEEIDTLLPISELFGFNWVNISFILDDELEFSIPRDEESIAKNIGTIKSEISVLDVNDHEIGMIVTSLNSGIYLFSMIFFTAITVLIMFFTIIIVKILVMPFMHSILKPINLLNAQLEKLADNNVDVKKCVIEQKKPPKEIQELIDHSNDIMAKFKNTNLELESSRDELEAQNMELDVQNAELTSSKIKLEATQNQLVQSEKMASIGQISAAIAHEINTPIGAVSSNAQMIDIMLNKLKKYIEENDEKNALIIVEKLSKSNTISIDASKRVNEIIKNLRNYSRIDQASFQNADINEGIKSVLVLTSNLWKNKVILDESYDNLPLISCYPSMLNQVFMNVIVNAIQASEKNGEIKIDTSFDDTYIKIEISDQGEGIKESDINKIFESGFTTKPKDKGTGLGLSISKNIIEKHNGSIRAYNNDHGATFEILLPLKQVKA